jgi:hypothetical protein
MSSTSVPTTANYALPSIAAAYGLALAPYYYGLCRMGIATKGRGWDLSMFVPHLHLHLPVSYNECRPRTNEARLAPSVSKSVLEACQRARWAHVNALENFPLFAAAMVRFVSHFPLVYLISPLHPSPNLSRASTDHPEARRNSSWLAKRRSECRGQTVPGVAGTVYGAVHCQFEKEFGIEYGEEYDVGCECVDFWIHSLESRRIVSCKRWGRMSKEIFHSQ